MKLTEKIQQTIEEHTHLPEVLLDKLDGSKAGEEVKDALRQDQVCWADALRENEIPDTPEAHATALVFLALLGDQISELSGSAPLELILMSLFSKFGITLSKSYKNAEILSGDIDFSDMEAFLEGQAGVSSDPFPPRFTAGVDGVEETSDVIADPDDVEQTGEDS